MTQLPRHAATASLSEKFSLIKQADTVGELKSVEICVSHMPSLKAKRLGKLAQEKVLLEL
jgi:hypothetical protein